MNPEHAYRYWRKAFVNEADGHFTETDFDKWFRRGSTMDVGEQLRLGSHEHFYVVMRSALSTMLEACSEGEFGKRSRR